MEQTMAPRSKSPSKRPPLAERSITDTNLRKRISDAPSIRIVADDGPDSYSETPFPTETAHFLPPKAIINSSKHSSYSSTKEQSVSGEDTSIKSRRESTIVEALLPLPVYPRQFSSQSDYLDTSLSSTADTLADSDNGSSFSPTLSSRFSQANTASSTPTLNQDEHSFVKPPLPLKSQARRSQSTIRLVAPSRTEAASPLVRSQSVSSSSSSGEPTTSGFRPESLSSSNGDRETWDGIEATVSDETSEEQRATIIHSLITSLNLQHLPSTESINTHESESSVVRIARQGSLSSSPSTSHDSYASIENVSIIEPSTIQYPVVRQQTTNGSWATISDTEQPSDAPVNSVESQIVAQDELNRMSHLSQVSYWSSRLSTIPSESDQGSGSLEIATIAALRSPKLRRVRGGILSSIDTTNDPDFPDFTPITIPQPLFSHPRTLSPLPARDSEEGEDTLGELPPLNLQPKRSGYLAKIKALSRPGSADSLHSQLSFSGDLDWVRRFYSGSHYAALQSPYSSPDPSMSRLDTTASAFTTSPLSEQFPAEIYRPRNRPLRNRQEIRPQQSRETFATDISWRDRIRRPDRWASSTFSLPHLHHDLRPIQQNLVLQPPSIDDLGKRPFGPVQRQIILFSVGFIFPISWFIAAFLSIPKKPETLDEKAPREHGISRRGDPNHLRIDVGATIIAEQLEKQYVKAHWWRSLNRIMCVAGMAIIGAIVSLSKPTILTSKANIMTRLP